MPTLGHAQALRELAAIAAASEGGITVDAPIRENQIPITVDCRDTPVGVTAPNLTVT